MARKSGKIMITPLSNSRPAEILLVEDNELSRGFPGGYRSIAPLLDPHRVWVAWKLIPPGKDAGMSYDGLVWLDVLQGKRIECEGVLRNGQIIMTKWNVLG